MDGSRQPETEKIAGQEGVDEKDMDDAKRSALIVATFSSFTTPFMLSAVNIALPAIQEEFHMNAVVLSWIPTSFLLAAAVFLVPFGRLADIHGRKKTFSAGMALFTLSSLLSALAPSIVALLVSRVLQGVGSAMIYATGIAIISSVFPPQERGKALGITVAAVYMGLSAGPFLGGFLTHLLGWRSVFWTVVPLGATVLLLVFWKLKGEWAEAAGEDFDHIGSILYGASVLAVIYGISLLPAATSAALIVGGLLGLGGFVHWEAKVKSPVFQVQLFKANRLFAFSNLAALIHYSATFAVTFLLSLYLQYIKGLTPQAAGGVLVAQPIMMALFSPFAGRLSDRTEPKAVASTGMALTCLGLVLLAFLGRHTGLAYVTGTLILLGLGFALFSSPNMNAIMGSVDRRFYGLASGAVGTMRLLGQVLSMGIATSLFAVRLGQVEITPEHHSTFIQCLRMAFGGFSVLCLGGIWASLVRGRLRRE